MLSRDFVHVVKDEQTPFAHCSADVPPAAVLVVVSLPPPPHAAAASTRAATAAPARSLLVPIAYIGSDGRRGGQEVRTSLQGRRQPAFLSRIDNVRGSRRPGRHDTGAR
jgi:hypothetical protein